MALLGLNKKQLKEALNEITNTLDRVKMKINKNNTKIIIWNIQNCMKINEEKIGTFVDLKINDRENS